jgi:hypothetical protein
MPRDVHHGKLSGNEDIFTIHKTSIQEMGPKGHLMMIHPFFTFLCTDTSKELFILVALMVR